MKLLGFLMELFNLLIDPATYEPITRCKTALLRFLSRVFGSKARIAASITITIMIVAFALYRMPRTESSPTQGTTGITWEQAGGGVIRISGIHTTLPITGGELIMDSTTIRFVTKNNYNLQGCHILTVPNGFYTKVIFPDGTVVWLNAGSRLLIPADFGYKKRELFLEGEGFFDIAPDPRKLLTIHNGQADILALGTSLNINSYGNNMKVSLVEGSIIVSLRDKKTQLKAGQELIMDKTTGQMAVDTFNQSYALGWIQGRYNTSGQTMEEVRAALIRWYNVNIVFDNPDLAKQLYNGAFSRGEPLETFLNNLKISGYLDYNIDSEGTVHLK